MIAKIERDHLVHTPLRPADLLFVFGTRRGIVQFADVIAELWSRRLFKWAIVTGGETARRTPSEAAILASAMREIGIPAQIILTEHRATNTGENVVFSMPIIDAHIGLSNVRSLIAVGKFHASVRYLMTLQRHWPDVDKMFASVQVFAQAEPWYEHAELRAKILEEQRKVQRYLELGYIDHWPGTPIPPPALTSPNPP